MKVRNIVVTLLLSALPATAPAQDETFFSEVVEVRVTNVDVVVTGRDGKPVTGLTRDDFEIYENGVKKEISNFLEMRGRPAAGAPAKPPSAESVSPAAEDVRRRDITIFVDDAVLHPFRRNAILPHLKRFVEESVRPGDSVSIVRWGQSLKLELEPTSDRAAIEGAVQRLMNQAVINTTTQERDEFYRGISMLIRAFQEKDPPAIPPWGMAISDARTYATHRLHQLRQRVEALKSVITWRRGVDGRKVLVILTEELTQNPAEDVFLYLDSIRHMFADVNSMAASEGRQFEYPSIIPELTQAANSAGVTLYPIHAAGKDAGMMDRSAEATLRLTPGGSIPVTTNMPSLQAIAADTGGVALIGSDNWKLAFDRVSSDLESYYSLGYRSEGEREDRLKKIDVRLKNKQRMIVRARSGVIERSIASEMQDAVSANLFRAASANELSVRAAAGPVAPAADNAESVVIPLTVTIPMDRITLIPEGTDLVAKLALYAAFLRKDGAVSKVAQQPASVRFPAESLKRRKELTLKMDVTADARTNGISVGVMDEHSRVTGFAGVKLE